MNEILAIFVVLAVVLGSMILHELAHGLMAFWLGDCTAKEEGRLTLNPLKHLDPMMSLAVPLVLLMSGGPVFGGAKPVPVDQDNLKGGAWGMALVAIAGPLTNIVIAFVVFLVWFMLGFGGNGLVQYTLKNIIDINLVLAVFNLMPIPPLDGSRVLFAVAPDAVREVMARMEVFGIVLVLALVVLMPQLTSDVVLGGARWIADGFFWLVGAD